MYGPEGAEAEGREGVDVDPLDAAAVWAFRAAARCMNFRFRVEEESDIL